jgi:uncharacterized protein YndB with AHSA1/START domain
MSTLARLHTTDQDLLITQTFYAPREAVWHAWNELHLARQWWGPKGFTIDELELAMRPGGAWRAVMHSPDDRMYPRFGVLEDSVAPERLHFRLVWAEGGPATEMGATITLAEHDRQTHLTFRKGPFPSDEWRRSEADGWNEAFDRLRAIVER